MMESVDGDRGGLDSRAGFVVVLALFLVLAIAFHQCFGMSAPQAGVTAFDTSPEFVWDYRGMDLLVQGLLVVGATIAVSTLLREWKGNGGGSDE